MNPLNFPIGQPGTVNFVRKQMQLHPKLGCFVYIHTASVQEYLILCTRKAMI